MFREKNIFAKSLFSFLRLNCGPTNRLDPAWELSMAINYDRNAVGRCQEGISKELHQQSKPACLTAWAFFPRGRFFAAVAARVANSFKCFAASFAVVSA